MTSARTVTPLRFQAAADGQTVGIVSAQHQVSIHDLLTANFIARHTRFSSIDAFLHASGLEPQGLVDLDAHAQSRWDGFVRAVSTFPNWNAMLGTARGEWLLRRLGIAVDIAR
jgi:hypothetical protein